MKISINAILKKLNFPHATFTMMKGIPVDYSYQLDLLAGVGFSINSDMMRCPYLAEGAKKVKFSY